MKRPWRRKQTHRVRVALNGHPEWVSVFLTYVRRGDGFWSLDEGDSVTVVGAVVTASAGFYEISMSAQDAQWDPILTTIIDRCTPEL